MGTASLSTSLRGKAVALDDHEGAFSGVLHRAWRSQSRTSELLVVFPGLTPVGGDRRLHAWLVGVGTFA